jgi:proton-dependent oligopeptide transporter, POT family
MSEPDATTTTPTKPTVNSILKELTQPFVDVVRAPRALWGVNVSYLLEGLTYFGVLSLLALFFNSYIGLNDINAGQMVGVLTGGITIAMTFLGATVDIIGVRKALLASLGLMLVGRVVITVSPGLGGAAGLWSAPHLLAMFGILWVIAGYGIYQPACYAAVKQFTTEKNAAMGYAMLYALMNLGGFLPGLISPPVRRAFGMTGVFWVYVALTVVGMAVVTILLTKKSIGAILATTGGEQSAAGSQERKPLKESIRFYLKNFPIRDYRFMFFIFILTPVQTLFAHNWLTLPQYFSRAFTGTVSDNFEFFVNFNPILIFVLTPVVAALTARKSTYSMMIAGTLVMGLPTFLLTLGPSLPTVFAYLIIMTLGEAMWSPRFLQWVAEIAPKGMTGIYMGIGQFPWFLTKVITSLYSGWFLMHYCPDGVPPSEMHTETMWFIYGLIAVVTPIGLWLAKGWMVKGFATKAAV